MIDCTKTENFLRERRRMCNSIDDNCTGCPLSRDIVSMGCVFFSSAYPDKAIAIVQKWSDEHPQKTMFDDFKEKYPNAPLDEEDGTPKTCPYNLGYVKSTDCPENDKGLNISCIDCWNRPYEEEQK